MASQSELASQWSRIEEKKLELALIKYPDGTPNRWSLIASGIQGRSLEQVMQFYLELRHDVAMIEAGEVELPVYVDQAASEAAEEEEQQHEYYQPGCDGIQRSSTETRKKRTAVAWTAEEHRLFLRGLETYGKGNWKTIARNVVKTKTASQIASHAQKFYIRQDQRSQKKETKRKSIHDITDLE